VLSSPKLSKDAILLHLTIESPEETLEALPLVKDYFSHIIHPLSATKGTQILRLF